MVWDTVSCEAGAPSDNKSEDEGGFEDKPGASHLQSDRSTTREVTRTAVRFLQMPLKKFFIMGHVNRSKHHPLRSGHGPFGLTEVQDTL